MTRFTVRQQLVRGLRVGAVIVAVLMAIALFVRGRCWVSFEISQPSRSIMTLADFTALMGTDYSYTAFEHNDSQYYEARRRPRFVSVPSGYTCYVFDASGKYVDWTWDNGDDPAWWDRWGRDELRNPTTLEQIETQLKHTERETTQ